MNNECTADKSIIFFLSGEDIKTSDDCCHDLLEVLSAIISKRNLIKTTNLMALGKFLFTYKYRVYVVMSDKRLYEIEKDGDSYFIVDDHGCYSKNIELSNIISNCSVEGIVNILCYLIVLAIVLQMLL